METLHLYKIMYNKQAICTLSAHSVWEAIDRAYYRYSLSFPDIDRKKIFAKKITK